MPKHVVVTYVTNNISIHQIVVLDSRYTPILVYKDKTAMTNHMIVLFLIANKKILVSGTAACVDMSLNSVRCHSLLILDFRIGTGSRNETETFRRLRGHPVTANTAVFSVCKCA